VLIRERCWHHPDREAAGRCTGCARFFCRECITEHDDRFICATCLERAARARTHRGTRVFQTTLLTCAGFIAAWVAFYAAAEWFASRAHEWQDNKTWQQR
jgi:hypothetical protein